MKHFFGGRVTKFSGVCGNPSETSHAYSNSETLHDALTTDATAYKICGRYWPTSDYCGYERRNTSHFYLIVTDHPFMTHPCFHSLHQPQFCSVRCTSTLLLNVIHQLAFRTLPTVIHTSWKDTTGYDVMWYTTWWYDIHDTWYAVWSDTIRYIYIYIYIYDICDMCSLRSRVIDGVSTPCFTSEPVPPTALLSALRLIVLTAFRVSSTNHIVRTWQCSLQTI